jgi:hypothetical protein
MKSIGSPGWVYRPLSEKRKAKMRDANLFRLGIPKGHHRLYGVNVPDAIHPAIRPIVHSVRQCEGIRAARRMAKTLVEHPELLDYPDLIDAMRDKTKTHRGRRRRVPASFE